MTQKNKAERIIDLMEAYFVGEHQKGKIAADSIKAAQYLNDNCVEVKNIRGQKAFVQEDDSYIIRNIDVFFVGSDINTFETPIKKIIRCKESFYLNYWINGKEHCDECTTEELSSNVQWIKGLGAKSITINHDGVTLLEI